MNALVTAHVEVCISESCTVQSGTIKSHVECHLEHVESFYTGMSIDYSDNPILKNFAHFIHLEVDEPGEFFLWQLNFIIHIFSYCTEGKIDEQLDGEENANVTALNQWTLPCVEYDGIWESLVYDSDIKRELIGYAESSLLFSNMNINSNIISLNRVILLHGPPGTGKTSLSKGIAQKLSIRLNHIYSEAHLIEINSHSLFSKWFSESGKLVQKLFQFIEEMIEDENSLIFVLIDEVESLTSARKSQASEPSDALRVVNALLTQLDQLRHRKNVLIITTSNLSDSIDVAFIDRADIKKFIGNPSIRSRYEILKSCLLELCRVGIIRETKFESFEAVCEDPVWYELLNKTDGFSGRSLRKLPFQAHAYYLHRTDLELEVYLLAMVKTADKELEDKSDL